MKKLSIIIPAYNEAKTLKEVLQTCLKQNLNNWQKEIIVVDDGSTDSSVKILDQFSSQIKIFKHQQNQGKGKALQTGFAQATGDAVLVQDADLEYSPKDWPELLKEFNGQNLVYGSRNLNPKRQGYRHFVWGVWLLTKIFNLKFKTKLTDLYTCYKLFPTKFIKNAKIESTGFEFEAEVSAKSIRAGYQINEVAIDYNPRSFAEGKKIKWLDGLRGIWTILKN